MRHLRGGAWIGTRYRRKEHRESDRVVRSALLMLRHIGEPEAALKIRNALEKVYRTRDRLTRDVAGKAGTSEFADAVIEEMQSTGAEQPATESSRS